jgi:hypothetical protein
MARFKTKNPRLTGNRGFLEFWLNLLEIHPHDAEAASDAVPHGLAVTSHQNTLTNVKLALHLSTQKETPSREKCQREFRALTKLRRASTKR